jgi:hypothetical protein
VSLVSKVQHMGKKNIERTGETDGFCDIRAKSDNNEKHTGRAKRRKKWTVTSSMSEGVVDIEDHQMKGVKSWMREINFTGRTNERNEA